MSNLNLPPTADTLWGLQWDEVPLESDGLTASRWDIEEWDGENFCEGEDGVRAEDPCTPWAPVSESELLLPCPAPADLLLSQSHLPHQQNFPWLELPLAVLQQGYLGKKKETGLQLDIICGSLATGRTWNPRKPLVGQATKQAPTGDFFQVWERPEHSYIFKSVRSWLEKQNIPGYDILEKWHLQVDHNLYSAFRNQWDHSSM